MWPLVPALSVGGAVSPTAVSWWDCQGHFLEPTCRAGGRRAGGRSRGDLALGEVPAKPARSGLCAGHVQQSGGESPLCNLMEVKHE